jgi:hypothetical protein
MFDAINCIRTHLHNTCPYCTSVRDVKRRSKVGIFKEAPKLGLFNFIERLIASDYPLGEELFEFFLIPIVFL